MLNHQTIGKLSNKEVGAVRQINIEYGIQNLKGPKHTEVKSWGKPLDADNLGQPATYILHITQLGTCSALLANTIILQRTLEGQSDYWTIINTNMFAQYPSVIFPGNGQVPAEMDSLLMFLVKIR